jgi:hypothetical protein
VRHEESYLGALAERSVFDGASGYVASEL